MVDPRLERTPAPGGPRASRAAILPRAVAAMVAMGITGAGGAAPLQAQEPLSPWVSMDVATVGVDLASGLPLALLRSGWDEVLPIWIGEVEAAAIARALAGIPTPRPMTHDLLLGVMESLEGTLEEVRVSELREETFIGVLRIRTATGIREVDSRPSDALALAARTGATVQVARELLGDLPDLEFLSVEGGRSLARVRGVTVADPGPGPQAAPGGVVVIHVMEGLGIRGLEPGDRIVSVAGRRVASPTEFVGAALQARPDAALEVERERGGERVTVRLPPRRPPAQVGP
jgi:uncharacterized protein